MNTWKLTIKPDSNKGKDPFKICYENNLIGIGWHHAYPEDKKVNGLDHARNLIMNHEYWKGKWPYQVYRFVEEMKSTT